MQMQLGRICKILSYFRNVFFLHAYYKTTDLSYVLVLLAIVGFIGGE